MPLIQLKNITKTYFLGESDLTVLKNINLSIEEGEFVAIMGPSGSGKSTLMQILGILDRPTSGVYSLLGKDVSQLSDDEGAMMRSRTIGFIFQMFNLLPRTSALDNVALPLIYSGALNREERSQELLKEVGLSDRMHHRPNQLSGGQQQRVAIARALVNRPRILFADEPTGNLASNQADEIMAHLRELNRGGITVIMVTHELDVASHAKRIIKIKDGVIVSDEKNQSSHLEKPSRPLPSSTVDLRTDSWFSFSELKEYTRSALKAITTNKVRSSLSVLGIMIGVAAVIAMLALGRGAQQSIETQLASLGSNLLMLRPGAPSLRGVQTAVASSSRLTMEDVEAIKNIPGVIRVDGNVSGSAQVVYGDKNTNTQVTGATFLYEKMRNSKPYMGRFFSDKEDSSQERVVLLGQTVVNKLFGDENPLGQYIKLNRINFMIIGILPLKGATGFRDQDDMVLIPLKTAMNRALGEKYLNNIAIECAQAEAISEVIVSLEELMRKRRRLPDYKENDFDIRNMSDIRAALAGTTQTFSVLLGIVAAISLLVGGIGIMNIMLVSVNERTREIGLRKAVGARRKAILSQFLIEATLLSTVGGLIGILFGSSVSFVLAKFANWASVVSLESILLSFVFSATVGIIFGFWPARKASLMSPIEALRYE
ncbi:MAG: ABC transporter permease [Elusimicrobiota bacterium]